jgi:death-on-curing protein
MMRFLTVSEVLEAHRQIIEATGGSHGCRDLGGLDSALAQPRMAFGGHDLYSTLAEKASALGFSLIRNHPFIDGNKRIGHAAMELFLMFNGHELAANVEEQERVILAVAASTMHREEFTEWVRNRIRPWAS